MNCKTFNSRFYVIYFLNIVESERKGERKNGMEKE